MGISTCPNDTFAFHALMSGEVRAQDQRLAFELHDVEELNRRMLAGELDVAKVSFHAALALGEEVTILRSGSALGFGVGPVVLAAAASAASPDAARIPRVLCPGRWTTATLLWRLYHPEPARIEQRVFSEIMPELEAGTAELGVCIHEGRFTWRERGLRLVEDLGARWEQDTGRPLPLGGIVARSGLGPRRLHALQRAVRSSLEWGLENRPACLSSMRRHAQEASDEILWAHVELYVNEQTLDLGAVGRGALETLSRRAASRDLDGLRGLPPIL
jgi:1,4-dihydroxy-6-naphthoate synthase